MKNTIVLKFMESTCYYDFIGYKTSVGRVVRHILHFHAPLVYGLLIKIAAHFKVKS